MSRMRSLGLCVLSVFIAASAVAATTPSSGTISPANPTLTFTGGPFPVSNPTNPLGENPPVCTSLTCGVYTLNVSVPATDFNSYKARLTVSWTDSGKTTQQSDHSDYDVVVYSPDVTGDQVATSPTPVPEVGLVATWSPVT